jgi:hypothetical protein
MELREIVLRTGVLMPQAGGLSLAVNTTALRHNYDSKGLHINGFLSRGGQQ